LINSNLLPIRFRYFNASDT